MIQFFEYITLKIIIIIIIELSLLLISLHYLHKEVIQKYVHLQLTFDTCVTSY